MARGAGNVGGYRTVLEVEAEMRVLRGSGTSMDDIHLSQFQTIPVYSRKRGNTVQVITLGIQHGMISCLG